MKQRPNIQTQFNDKLRIQNLIKEVISDAWIYTHNPDSVTADENDLVTLVFENKKFVFDDVKVDETTDYVDIYVTGIKISETLYTIEVIGTDIIVKFNTDELLVDFNDLSVVDFVIKGKIVGI